MACPLDLFISSSSSIKVTGTLSFPFLCVSSLPFRRTSFGVVGARLFVFALGVVERRLDDFPVDDVAREIRITIVCGWHDIDIPSDASSTDAVDFETLSAWHRRDDANIFRSRGDGFHRRGDGRYVISARGRRRDHSNSRHIRFLPVHVHGVGHLHRHRSHDHFTSAQSLS